MLLSIFAASACSPERMPWLGDVLVSFAMFGTKLACLLVGPVLFYKTARHRGRGWRFLLFTWGSVTAVLAFSSAVDQQHYGEYREVTSLIVLTVFGIICAFCSAFVFTKSDNIWEQGPAQMLEMTNK